jgi:Replication initiator protein, pSAM2
VPSIARARIPRGGVAPEAPSPATAETEAGLDPALIGDLCRRAGDPAGLDRWRAQVRSVGFCQRPIRLAGAVEQVDQATGEAVSVLDSAELPDGVLLKACGTRRAARCAPCAEVYCADAYQLLKAGLAGGKSAPETVGDHPRLLVTFTAPSFGLVHSCRVRHGRVQRCHPARPEARCPHDRPRRCAGRHLPGDPMVGTPLCLDCYDLERAVVWNALAPELWRRTTIYLRRTLARVAGLTAAEGRRQVRPACAKVVEYQARGAVHLHAIIRLDASPPAEDDPDEIAALPPRFTVGLLAEAIRQAAAEVAVPCPLGGPPLRWGEQLDLRPIGENGAELSVKRVAGYVAKYATKATEGYGAALDGSIRDCADLDQLDGQVPAHVAALVRAAWALGARPELTGLRLRRGAHLLGYRGHFLTKSRRYSTTFRALRAARRAWVAIGRRGPTVPLDQDGRVLPPEGSVLVAAWEYQGRGYTTAADAWLAGCMGRQDREMRRVAREELSAVA